MAIQLLPTEKDIWRIVQAVVQLVEGRQNSVGDLTLAVGQTSTTVDFPNCSKDCRVFLQPQNSVARGVPVSVDISDTLQASFIVRHAAAPASARFSFLCIGG